MSWCMINHIFLLTGNRTTSWPEGEKSNSPNIAVTFITASERITKNSKRQFEVVVRIIFPLSLCTWMKNLTLSAPFSGTGRHTYFITYALENIVVIQNYISESAAKTTVTYLGTKLMLDARHSCKCNSLGTHIRFIQDAPRINF